MPIESAVRWSNYLDIAGIAALALGVLSELIAFFCAEKWKKRLEIIGIVFFALLAGAEYGKRKCDQRIEQARTQKEQAKDAQIAGLQQDLSKAADSAKTSAAELQREQTERERQEQLRRTPPQLRATLAITGKGSAVIRIESLNSIPFEFRPIVVTKNDIIVSGIPMEWGKVFPTSRNKIFFDKADIQANRVRDRYLELRFTWKSLSADELKLPHHTGEIVQKYLLDDNAAKALGVP